MLFGYLSGSVPFGFLIAGRGKGIDIRNFGSGNIGATNIARILGFKWGALVFILDFMKGLLPVLLVFLFLPKGFFLCRIISILVALLAVIGHNWPLYLNFKGGKGVSTSIGVMSALSINLPFLRLPVSLAIVVWLFVFVLSRIVGLASLAASFVFFVSSLVMVEPWEFKVLSFLLAFFIAIRHQKNIKEIINKYKAT